jgi:hypothetical protein
MTCQANTKERRGKVELGLEYFRIGLASPLLKVNPSQSFEQDLCHGTPGFSF